MSKAFSFSVDSEGIGRLVFDLPNEKVNKINIEVLDELSALLNEIKGNPKIKALLFVSAKEGVFIAGLDLTKVEEMFENQEMVQEIMDKGHGTFRQLETLPFPTIAVINGACMGGGCELALSCTYRIATDHPKVLIGLPEVNLGIFPGWGGSQRMPRLVGLMKGLQLILTGKPVDWKKASKMNVVDGVIPEAFKEEKMVEFAKYCLTSEGKKAIQTRRKPRGLMHWLLERNPIGRAIVFWQAKKDVLKKTKGKYPAPLVALQLIKKTYGTSLEKGLKVEKETFIKKVSELNTIAKHLIRLFFNSEKVKKHPNLPDGATPLKVETVGVIGAGTMGSGISWVFSYRDYAVRMKDISLEAIARGTAAAREIYNVLVKKRRLKPFEANNKFLKIGTSIDYTGFQHADLVIEAAVEDLALKKKIYQELEGVVRADTVIASNTSSLTIEEMAEGMKHPERLVGMHFFNPASRMPLVEVVAGKNSSPDAVATAVEICKKIKKTPIVVGDCPGFLVNRVFVIGVVELLVMLEEGVSISDLEKALVDFGMPMPPFILADEVGNDVNSKVMHSFERAYGERMRAPSIIDKMVEKGWLGKKSGTGFYIYDGKKKSLNPGVEEFLPAAKVSCSKDEIVHRVIFSMVNEASRCLDEGIINDPMYLDIAMVFGVGFPPFRGGLLRYADEYGVQKMVEKMKSFGEGNPRFEPCERLVSMVNNGCSFYNTAKESSQKQSVSV